MVVGEDTTPRMRGLLQVYGDLYEKERYNPAYAGTTWCQAFFFF